MARNPLLKFKDEILQHVIYPKLALILRDQTDLNIEMLHDEFREKYNCEVSFREFKEWCDRMHLRCETVTAWNLEPRVVAIPGINSNEEPPLFIDVSSPTDPKMAFDNE